MFVGVPWVSLILAIYNQGLVLIASFSQCVEVNDRLFKLVVMHGCLVFPCSNASLGACLHGVHLVKWFAYWSFVPKFPASWCPLHVAAGVHVILSMCRWTSLSEAFHVGLHVPYLSTLRRWRKGQEVGVLEAHKAAIQAIIKLPSGELVTGIKESFTFLIFSVHLNTLLILSRS